MANARKNRNKRKAFRLQGRGREYITISIQPGKLSGEVQKRGITAAVQLWFHISRRVKYVTKKELAERKGETESAEVGNPPILHTCRGKKKSEERRKKKQAQTETRDPTILASPFLFFSAHAGNCPSNDFSRVLCSHLNTELIGDPLRAGT